MGTNKKADIEYPFEHKDFKKTKEQLGTQSGFQLTLEMLIVECTSRIFLLQYVSHSIP